MWVDPFDRSGPEPGRLDQSHNPFAIAPGQIPPAMVGRDRLHAELRDQVDRVARRMPGEWWVVEGHHGLGRTALLHRVSEVCADRDVEGVVLDLARGADEVLETMAVTVRRWGIHSALPTDVSGAVDDLLRGAEQRMQSTCLLLDNAHGDPDTALAVLHGAERASAGRGATMAVLTGVPGSIERLGARAASLERLPVRKLDLLAPDAVQVALSEPFHHEGIEVDTSAVMGVTVHSEGHPHLVQLWGRELWREARLARPLDRRDVEVAAPRVDLALDQLHGRRWARLNGPQRTCVSAIARLGTDRASVGEIAGRLGQVPWDPRRVLGRLERDGIVSAGARGTIELTMPHMGRWVAARCAPSLARASWREGAGTRGRSNG